MPNLGAGVDQHVNVAAVPTWVFTPTPGVTATARFFNEGSQVAYIGQSYVTSVNGLPVLPNCRVELPNVNVPLYAASGVNPSALNSTTLSGAQTAGASSFTVASGTGFAVGGTIQFDAGAQTEYLILLSGSSTIWTAASTFLYNHATGVAAKNVTVNTAQLRVGAGAV
jgi:hypothetical protein